MTPEYEGREQSFIKHVVLTDYFEAWTYKITASKLRRRIWYVDCFAGPWEAKEPNLEDTSFAKALSTLNRAVAVCRGKLSRDVSANAIFVEKVPASYERLSQYVDEHSKLVDAHTFNGAFGDLVEDMAALMDGDPGFIFVDPTGWKGADMRFIKPIASIPGRDVLINVMFEHINRFKDSDHPFLPQQMRDFFGLIDDDLPPSLSEEEVMTLYRRQLQDLCGIPYVADLVVPLPTANKTKFRLVVGGHHHEALRLFRDVERKACGKVAAAVRTAARDRAREERMGMPSLFPTATPDLDPTYADLRSEGLATVRENIPRAIRRDGPLKFLDLWVRILPKFHVTVRDVSDEIVRLRDDGVVVIHDWKRRQKKLGDRQTVSLP